MSTHTMMYLHPWKSTQPSIKNCYADTQILVHATAQTNFAKLISCLGFKSIPSNLQNTLNTKNRKVTICFLLSLLGKDESDLGDKWVPICSCALSFTVHLCILNVRQIFQSIIQIKWSSKIFLFFKTKTRRKWIHGKRHRNWLLKINFNLVGVTVSCVKQHVVWKTTISNQQYEINAYSGKKWMEICPLCWYRWTKLNFFLRQTKGLVTQPGLYSCAYIPNTHKPNQSSCFIELLLIPGVKILHISCFDVQQMRSSSLFFHRIES